MKNGLKKLSVYVLIALSITVALYVSLYFYYKEVAMPNIWVNGYYVTGLRYEDMDRLLKSEICYDGISIVLKGETSDPFFIKAEDIDLTIDYKENLKDTLEKRNPLLWPKYVFYEQNLIVSPVVGFDIEKLDSIFSSLDPVIRENSREKNFEITFENGEFSLYDGLSDRLDTDKLYDALMAKIKALDSELIIDEAYFYDIDKSESQLSKAELFKKIDSFQNAGLIYDMGEENILFTKKIMNSFLVLKDDLPVLNDDGLFEIDEDAVDSFVENLKENYDTYGKKKSFLTAEGYYVNVKYVTYGTLIDEKKEKEYLKNLLESSKIYSLYDKKHIPFYIKETKTRGLHDYGDTYIEVNLTDQKLYYFKEGGITLETDIVTGKHDGTPEGVYYVYKKQTNRILRGPGYASHVNYWMPVYKNIGIHDAAWRSEFGGELFVRNGSHGCINTPSDFMPTLYEAVEVGTLVIIYKHE
ncbi:MAG: L,D-transpeptidase [Acetatifactor sp.]|nr:L,D-transpeptidase [Acetatifactor sp.]